MLNFGKIFRVSFKRMGAQTSLAVQWLILPSKAGASSIPGQRGKIPHASWPKTSNIKQKQYCKKFNKNFKMVHLKKKSFKNIYSVILEYRVLYISVMITLLFTLIKSSKFLPVYKLLFFFLSFTDCSLLKFPNIVVLFFHTSQFISVRFCCVYFEALLLGEHKFETFISV